MIRSSHIAATVIAICLGAALVTAAFWQELLDRKVAVALRDVYFIAAGLIAAVVAWWRGAIAERQDATSRKQERIDSDRLVTDRYQKAAELLGSNSDTVRVAGIYALTYLAISERESDPDSEYFAIVLNLLKRFKVSVEDRPEPPPWAKGRPADSRVADECLKLLQSEEDGSS